METLLLKQKFVVLCRVENLLIQNTGHLNEWNFATAKPPLQSVFVSGLARTALAILFWTIGRSAATPLNTGISWMSNYLLIIVWCWNSLNRIKKVSVNQHTKSVLSLLQLFLLLCLPLSLLSNLVFVLLLKQKFVVLCRAENSLMQNTGHLNEWNFGTAKPPLQSVFVSGLARTAIFTNGSQWFALPFTPTTNAHWNLKSLIIGQSFITGQFLNTDLE